MITYLNIPRIRTLPSFILAVLLLASPVIAQSDSVDADTALNALLLAEQDVHDMVFVNFSVYYVNDTLLRAKRFFIGENTVYLEGLIADATDAERKAYLESLLAVAQDTPTYEVELRNFDQVLVLSEEIHVTRERAFALYDGYAVFDDKLVKYEAQGVNTTDVVSLFHQSQDAFASERYDDAEQLLADAQISLDLVVEEHERQGRLSQLSKNFLEKYWWLLLIILGGIVMVAGPSVRGIQRRRARRKLEALKIEYSSLEKLLRQAQDEVFNKKSITLDSYKVKEQIYKKRMTEIKHTIPVLEATVRGSAAPAGEKPKKVGLKV